MLDLDQRVVDGLRDLVGRAPVDADVWPAAERFVARRRRQRHAIAGAVVGLALVAGALTSAAVIRGGSSKPVTTEPTPTTAPVLSADGPVDGFFEIRISYSGVLRFDPASLTVKTGVYAVVFADGQRTSHTLNFDDPTTRWSPLRLTAYGEVMTSRVFFGHAGDYTFFCAVPGHRDAGEHGVVHVTGPTLTLAQAEAAGSPVAEAPNVG